MDNIKIILPGILSIFYISYEYKNNNNFEDYIDSSKPLFILFIFSYLTNPIRNVFRAIGKISYLSCLDQYIQNFGIILILINFNNYQNLLYSITALYIILLWTIKNKYRYAKIANIILFFSITGYYVVSPNNLTYIWHKKSYMIAYFLSQISILVLVNNTLVYFVKIKYPAWVNKNLIIYGGFYLWSLLTICSYFILNSFDAKILFGWFIIFYQIKQNKGFPSKQFRSIPNQLLCILIDCYSFYIGQCKNRETQKIINNKKFMLFNKGKWSVIKMYKLKIGDIIQIEQGDYCPQHLYVTHLSNNEKLYSIDTSKIDGEKNDKIRKVFTGKYIDYINIDKNYQTNIYLVPKGSIINKKCLAKVVFIEKSTFNIFSKSSIFDKSRIKLELSFIFITLVILSGLLAYYSIFKGTVDVFSSLAILMVIQVINPMTLNNFILYTMSNFKFNNISIIGKNQLLSFQISKHKYHFTDKTGTLTQNKLKFFGLAHVNNNKWILSNINETNYTPLLLSITNNDPDNLNIVPEENSYFKDSNISWVKQEILNNGWINRICKLNNNHYNIETLNLGIDTQFKGCFSVMKIGNQYKLIIQSSTQLFDTINKNSSIKNISNKTIEDIKNYSIFENLLNNHDGAPRYWCLLESELFDYDNEDKFKHVFLKTSGNNKLVTQDIRKYLYQLIDNLNFNFIGVLLLKDLFREGAKDICQFNSDNNITTGIITGDNLHASKSIGFALGFGNPIIINNLDDLNDFDKKNFLLMNSNTFYNITNHFHHNELLYFKYLKIVFHSCSSKDKKQIVDYFQNKLNTAVVFSGDGCNDIEALSNATLSIGFPAGNEIDSKPHENIKLASGITTTNDFWKDTYVNSKLFNYSNQLLNKCISMTNVIIMKQTLITGIIIGNLLVNNFDDIQEPFGVKYYQIFMIYCLIIFSINSNKQTHTKWNIFNFCLFGLKNLGLSIFIYLISYNRIYIDVYLIFIGLYMSVYRFY